MRLLALLFLMLSAAPAAAQTFGFGIISLTGTTGIGGTVSSSIKVPGTFGGLNPADPTAGRYLKLATVWVDAPAAGDELTTLDVEDTDGVVPSPARGAFSNYPVIFNLLDTATGGTSALMIPSAGITLESFDQSGLPAVKFIPSGLYIKTTYQAGGLGITKTFRVVIRWGIWQ